MARPRRLEFYGAVYHLTARGNRQESIFLDDTDRQIFLDLLGKEINQQSWGLLRLLLDGQPLPIGDGDS